MNKAKKLRWLILINVVVVFVNLMLSVILSGAVLRMDSVPTNYVAYSFESSDDFDVLSNKIFWESYPNENLYCLDGARVGDDYFVLTGVHKPAFYSADHTSTFGLCGPFAIGIIHTHPSGLCIPSDADRVRTLTDYLFWDSRVGGIICGDVNGIDVLFYGFADDEVSVKSFI